MLWNRPEESWRDFAISCHRESASTNNLTLELQADAVVKAHNANNGQLKTKRHFNPSSVTETNRLKANEGDLSSFMKSKDAVEMLPYLLAAMTDEAKLSFASQYLKPAGLTVHLSESDEESGFGVEAACELQLHIGTTFDAVYSAAKSQAPECLDKADRQIVQAIVHLKGTRKLIAGARTIGAKVKSVIHRATAPKETA